MHIAKTWNKSIFPISAPNDINTAIAAF